MTTLVDCPQSRGGEWNFRLFGIDVRVKFWFWATLLLLGGDQSTQAVLIWIAVCFVSILIHELGHVVAFRFFGTGSEIVLYGFGGLTIPGRNVRGTLAEFVVALSGPMAGFGVVGLVFAWAVVMRATIVMSWRMLLPVLSVVPTSPSPYLYVTLNDLLFVNFFWGLVNLLPVWPLDGGHAARAVCEQRDPYRGRRHSLILSAVVAGMVALFGIAEQSLYMALAFGIICVSSLQKLSDPERTLPRGYRPNR